MERKPYPSETQERFIVRLPDGMRDRIADSAKFHNRSMNSEIVARLTASLDDFRDANTQASMLAEIYFLLDAQKQELLALHKQSMAELIEAANTPLDQRKRLASKLPDATEPSIEAGVKRLRPKVHESVRTEHPFLDDRRRNSKTSK